MNALIEKGDIGGASKIADALKAKGVELGGTADQENASQSDPSMVCAACGEPPSGACGMVGGKMYHKKCLKCVLCSAQLDGKLTQTRAGLTCEACCKDIES